jgi:hypothetical protein
MISVIDLDGNSFPVPSKGIRGTFQLYSILRSSYGLSNFRLFSNGQLLRNDPSTISPDILSGCDTVALVRDLVELQAIPMPTSFAPTSRFRSFYFSRPSPTTSAPSFVPSPFGFTTVSDSESPTDYSYPSDYSPLMDISEGAEFESDEEVLHLPPDFISAAFRDRFAG